MLPEIRQVHFPSTLTPTITAVSVEPANFWPVTARLTEKIETPFAELGLYEPPQERAENGRFLRQLNSQRHHDYFLFHNEEGEPIGWSMGNMLDSSTYFMAWTAVLPSYQRQGIYTSFLTRLLAYLKALGYERVTSNHFVTNRPVLIAKLKAGFIITGLSLDERFGAQVTLTRFFYPDRQTGFATAFSLAEYS